MSDKEAEFSLLLRRTQEGDDAAKEELFTALASELHAAAAALMRRERIDHTLQPSALLNEALMRLLSDDVLQRASDRRYLFASANKAMQRILVDHARSKKALKRGDNRARSPLDLVIETLETRDKTSIVELTEALELLRERSPRQAEVVELRFFSGLRMDEIAVLMDLSEATVKREWTLARTKLFRLLGGIGQDAE